MSEPDAFTMLLSADIRLALKKGELAFVEELLQHLHPADIADIIETLKDDEASQTFELLTPEIRVETFEHLEEYQRIRLLEFVPKGKIIPVIEAMSSDDRADLFKKLPEDLIHSIFPHLDQEEKKDIKYLISYEEGTAGSVMTTEYVAIRSDMNVEEALAHIRKVAPHRETVYYLYVVDQQGRLQGNLSLRELVIAGPAELIGEIMNPNVISVGIHDDQEEVALSIQKYDFLAMPVVDEDNHMVGIVTYDDIMDVVEIESTEDAHKMGAVSPLEESYMQTPFGVLVRKRVFWLSLLFIGEMFTSTALSHFEHVLNQYIALVFFIPLIISAGGNAGSQSSTLIVRDMSVGDISPRDWFPVVSREIFLGIFIGFFLGLMGLARAYILGTGFDIALVVMITVMLIVALGAFLGSFLPMGFEKMGLDPAVTSAPFVASLVDILGIVLYLMIAKAVLGL